jgi:hypothetical protein
MARPTPNIRLELLAIMPQRWLQHRHNSGGNIAATGVALSQQNGRRFARLAEPMSNPRSIEEIRTALASAAKTYQPARRPRYARLIPFKAEIQELREHRASFQTIAAILKRQSVMVSHELVRRFYREVIEQKAPMRRKKQNGRKRAALPPRAVNAHANGMRRPPSVAATERGPRIARVEDL